jgi:pimeloyl-ACP methyl ester carboxylesterase
VRLHAREWGNRNGPAILFIHGWSQCDACWAKQVRGSLAATYRLLTVDLRGHGLSEKPTSDGAYGDEGLWAQDVAAVIDQTGLECPVLVAWSYGGYVVTDYLRAYGDSGIAGLDLVSAALVLKPPTFDHIGSGMLENVPAMCAPDLLANIAATRRFLANCSARPLADDEAIAALGWNMVVPAHVRAALLAREIDGGDALSSTSIPVLVTHGTDDAIVLPSMAGVTLDKRKSAVPSWYDGVGHMPFWESSERFDRELSAFANRVS